MTTLKERLNDNTFIPFHVKKDSSYYSDFIIQVPTHIKNISYIYKADVYDSDVFQPYSKLEYIGAYYKDNNTYYYDHCWLPYLFRDNKEVLEGINVKEMSELIQEFKNNIIEAFKSCYHELTPADKIPNFNESDNDSTYGDGRIAYDYYINSIPFNIDTYVLEQVEGTLLDSSYFEKNSRKRYENVLFYIAHPEEAVAQELKLFFDARGGKKAFEHLTDAHAIKNRIDELERTQTDYYKKHILTGIREKAKDAKTLNVTFVKAEKDNPNNIHEMTLKVETDRLSYGTHMFDDYNLVTKADKDAYCKYFNWLDVEWEEVTQITYGRNLIYDKSLVASPIVKESKGA